MFTSNDSEFISQLNQFIDNHANAVIQKIKNHLDY